MSLPQPASPRSPSELQGPARDTRSKIGRLLESTAPQSESGWALKLKQVSEAAAETLSTEVLSVRLIHEYDSLDRDAALFELETPQGLVQAILSRSGEYSFFWKR
ncbi:MAG: hypothetical protein HY291_24310 [Planctomycetes bacterium]|nr:hypothetical protein [Planctomycetota bacterium]